MHADVKNFNATLPVTDNVRQLSLDLDADIIDEEIRTAMKRLRPGAGGGGGPVVLKTLFQDPTLASLIGAYIRQLWSTPATQWKEQGLDGPGLSPSMEAKNISTTWTNMARCGPLWF